MKFFEITEDKTRNNKLNSQQKVNSLLLEK